MKYCEKCEKEYDTDETQCPVCGAELVDNDSEEEAAETVATMTILGIL